METLPDEIMVDVLSRLSLKTLLQCRGVCTTWRSIILWDPDFANVHLTRASQVDLPCLVYKRHSDLGEPPQLCLIDFNSNDGQDHTLDIESKHPIAVSFEPRFHFGAILSCNGLLCLCDYFHNPIYVCNPVTRDHITLPKRWSQFKDRRFIPGFGFDATNKEYKVIRLMYFEKHGVASDLTAEVYTLGSGAWRSIGSPGCRVISEHRSFSSRNFSGPVNIHGTLHWIINLTIPEIVAWDVSDEKFRVVPCPEELVLDEDYYSMCLMTINKCLSIRYSHRWLDFVNMWIMKDYNVKESWIKEVRVDTMPDYRWFMESSLTLNYRARMDFHVKAIYSCEERRFREVCETHFPGGGRIEYCTMDIATHVGSFISVRGVAASRVQSAKRKRR